MKKFLGLIQTQVDQDGVLLCCQLLEKILIRCIRGLLPLWQAVTQTMLLEEQEPHLTSPAFRNPCSAHINRKRRSEKHRTCKADIQ